MYSGPLVGRVVGFRFSDLVHPSPEEKDREISRWGIVVHQIMRQGISCDRDSNESFIVRSLHDGDGYQVFRDEIHTVMPESYRYIVNTQRGREDD